jgi:hypothetical protein
VRARISAQIAANARRSAPARAAAIRICSACSRNSSGIAAVHFASCRATDLVIASPSASPASNGPWSSASLCTAMCPAAWPLVTREVFTIQARMPRCPSPTGPSWASNAAIAWPRTAAPTASARSSARNNPLSASHGVPAISMRTKNPIADPSMASASAIFAGPVAVLIVRISPPPWIYLIMCAIGDCFIAVIVFVF